MTATATRLPKLRLGEPYLFGFLYTRLTDEYSDRQMWAHLSPRDNLHRHPDRQMWRQLEDGDDNDNDGSPKKPHRPHHDIYSLGVVLLEIGLGRPADELVKLAPHMTGGGIEQVAREMTDARSAARRAKLVFLALAETALPGTMGDVYANITRMLSERRRPEDAHI